MSEQTLVKKKARSLLSVMTAALLTTGGVLAAPAVALADEAPVDEPQITVTPSKDLDPAEDHTLTVEGTGFVGEGAAMGAYVLFGEQSVWSGGEPLEADGWIAQDWVQASKITDGSFSTELTIPADSLEPGTKYHVATSAAHGLSMGDRSLDAFAEVTVLQEEESEAPVADPQLTVTPNEDLDPEVENTLTVEGEGFLGEAASQGVYVVFGDRSIWSGEGGLVQDGWIAIEWVQPNQISEGAFSVEIEVKAGELDPEVNYHVATSAAHDLSQTDRSLDSFVAVTVLDETEPEPETPVADPQLSVTPTEDLDPTNDQTLTVEGEGYVGDGAEQGVYVLFGETSIWSGEAPLVAEGWVALDWVRANQIVDGSFSLELDVPAGKLDSTKEYHVATSAAHKLSETDRSLDAFAPVTVQQEEAPEAPEDTTPAVIIDGLENGEVRQGDEVTFVGTGFEAGDRVTVTVNSDPVVVAEDAEVDENGEVSAAWTVPNDFALGAHTVVFAVDGEGVADAEFSVLAAAAEDGANNGTGDANNTDTNKPGTEQNADAADVEKLAHTGGEATAIFVLAGLSLLVGTGAMFARMRKAKLEI